jgi:cellulose synthase operon protein C
MEYHSMRKFMPLVCLAVFSLAVGPARAETPEEQLAAASALFSAERYADAAQKLDAFLVAYPKHAKTGVVAFTLGRCRSELKQYPQAVSAYEKAIASRDASVSQLAHLGLGEAATYAHEYDKAANALEVAVKGALKPEQAAPAWYWLGQADFQLQKYDQAQQAYDKVFHDFGRSDFADAAYYGAGMAALKQKKTDEARQDFRTLISRYPKSDDRPQATLLLAQIDLEARRYPEARAGFESLLRNFASTQKGQKIQAASEDGLIQCLLAMEDYNAAAGRLETAIGRLPAGDPQRFRAQLSLGHSRYHLKDYDLAYAAYVEASHSAEPVVAAESTYWAGNAALAQNKSSEAAAQFTRYVAKYPGMPLASKAQLRAADAYQSAKQATAARLGYQAVVANYPQSPEANEARQALQEIKGEKLRSSLQSARRDIQAQRYVEAQAGLAALVKTNPQPDVAAEAQYLLGVVYEALKKSAPAAAAYTESLRLKPSAAWAGDAQASLAWIYLDLKQPANAERAANAVIALNRPKEQDEQARLALIQALMEQSRWDAVLGGCKTILDKSPAPATIATVLYVEATTFDRQKKQDEALPVWEKIATDYPKSDYAAQALLRVGDADSKAEKWADAQAKYAQILADFPQSPVAVEARFNLGTALFRQDKFAEAAAEYNTVAETRTAGDFIPESLYWAGVAYAKAENKDEAIKRLSTLVEKYPKHARVQNARTRLAALKAVKGA